MEDWKERLVNETLELNDKYVKLDRFMCSEKFDELDLRRKYLLNLQKSAMLMYLSVLTERIMTENINLPYTINLGSKI